MAVVYGLTDRGFFTKPLTAIRDDLNTAFRNVFGQSISLNDRSVFGIIIGIIAERISISWQQLEVLTTSLDPNKAGGTLLEALATLTGTFRAPAVPSKTTLTFTGSDGTVVSAGFLTKTSALNDFVSLASTTLASVPAWVPSTSYVLDDRVTRAGNVYQNIQAGTSAGSGGPTGTNDAVDVTADGGCLWTFVGPGAAAADASSASVENGPIVGTRKDITQIVNPTLGLDAVTNLAAADLGRLEATDSELRQTRENELAAAGSSPLDALLANLEQIAGVTSVTLFPNSTDTTVDGVPPHSIEALIEGGTDQDIYDELLASIAVGIGTVGNHTGTATDSQGNAQTFSFSRPESVAIHAAVSLTFDTTSYPADGDIQVKNALDAYVAALNAGRDVTSSALGAQAFKVAGVLDVTEVLVYTDVIGAAVAWVPTTGYSATVGSRSVVTNGGRKYICITSGTSAGSVGPTGTGTDITDGGAHWRYLGNSIAITSRQLASLAFANTAVTSTSGTP
jgi:uncharacterized phage protein gp47/JayE